MQIRSKAEFYELWKAGALGNRTKLTTSLEEAQSWHSAEIGFREVGKAGGGAWTKTAWINAPVIHADWVKRGRRFIMDDSVPNDKQTILGEIGRGLTGLYGVIGTTPLPMRPAAKQGLLLPRTGATILALLDRFMDPSSRDDVYQLLDLYPDATIEFSCFTVDVGNIPGRNTMIWEVRNY